MGPKRGVVVMSDERYGPTCPNCGRDPDIVHFGDGYEWPSCSKCDCDWDESKRKHVTRAALLKEMVKASGANRFANTLIFNQEHVITALRALGIEVKDDDSVDAGPTPFRGRQTRRET
jgi:hypothetical protein